MVQSNPLFKKFSSKLLLFGEYTLMAGSEALTIPLNEYGGQLILEPIDSVESIRSNFQLKKFYDYLFSKKDYFPEGLELDLSGFKNDLDKGLYLSSDIPQGYGAGSSGVLVAAVYHAYTKNPPAEESTSVLRNLKHVFSFMESFFHGRSSGIDPLSCYIGKPLRMTSPEITEPVTFIVTNNTSGLFMFLLDTGFPSRTGGLVQIFQEKQKSKLFMDAMVNKIIPATNKCIALILSADTKTFEAEIRQLSALQLEFFQEMIPDPYKMIWENGIKTENYSLKLCGSGGGGFILGFAEDRIKTTELFENMGKKLLPVFKSS